jgi:L-ascorbate metabolism protein UlaG (beta-lactamase superfamily)
MDQGMRCFNESGPGPTSIAVQVQSLLVSPGHVAVWALGQHGYLLKGGERVVAIDPYLSNYVEETSGAATGALARQVPVVVRPDELGMVDTLLVTHHHADHCDPQTILPLAGAARDLRVLTSYKAREALLDAGLDWARIEVPAIDREVRFGENISVTAVPSAHYDFEPDDHGNPAYLGFIVRLNRVALYHSGDTVIYPGLVERLQDAEVDIACLPINGRDWFREQEGLVGNMDYREAADLAGVTGVKVLLPSHNDMFAGNRINPSYLLDYLSSRYPQQRVHFLQAGELYYYAG